MSKETVSKDFRFSSKKLRVRFADNAFLAALLMKSIGFVSGTLYKRERKNISDYENMSIFDLPVENNLLTN
jgi:cbb3-type cytochrome oxidase subunit 3